jgi:hypothetical protein
MDRTKWKGPSHIIKWFEDLVPNTVTETVPISDLTSLCGALDSFSGELGRMPPKRFIAPCELNALGLRGRGFFGHRFQHLYRVVVGSTPGDFAFYWNSCRIDDCWRVPYLGALWVPAELAHDASFLLSLKNWLTWQT